MSEHEPTAVIQRTQRQKMLEASTQPLVAHHAVARPLFEHREDSYEGEVSPLAVLGVIGLLITLFVLIVQTQ